MDGRRVRVAAAIASLLVMIAACSDDSEVREYRASRDPGAAGGQTAAPYASQQTQPSAARQMRWRIPEGWRTVPSEVAKRAATLQAGQGDLALEVAITNLSGPAGGVLPNVNRWMQQNGQPELTTEQLNDQAAHHHLGEIHVLTIRIDSAAEPGRGMLGAVIEGDPAQTWFLRANGTREQLDAHQPAFIELARSFHFAPADTAAPAADYGAADRDPHASAGDAPHGVPHAPFEHHHPEPAAELTWTVPEGWRPITSRSPIVYATFDLSEPDTPAAVIVTPLMSDGGPLLDNINMWRAQIGLDPIDDLAHQPIEPITVSGVEGRFLPIEGSDHSVLVAIVPQAQAQRTWFFRMTGAAEAVEQHRQAFKDFVTSTQFIGE